MSGLVQCDIADGIARIALDRPDKRNALSRELIDELSASVRAVGDDESVRVVLFEANGPVFCAGMDLGEMQERTALDDEAAAEAWEEDSRVYRDLLLAIVRLPMPTIAVVQGPAVAGGVGLVLACDLVVAAESAWFELPEPRRGLVAAMVAPLLVHRVGTSLATRMLLGMERIDAAEGLRCGLVHDVAETDALDAKVRRRTDAITGGAPTALSLTKRLLVERFAGDDALSESVRLSAEARGTDDAIEGRAAFLERRSPRWARD